VHAVHDAAVAGEDDGIGEVARVDESRVIYDLSAGELHGAFVTPIGFVQLTNCGERYAFSWEGVGEIDETMDGPGAEALRRLAEVVLDTHFDLLCSVRG